MQSNSAYKSLLEMGFSPVICEAAIRQVKSQDLSVLLDWVSNHGEEEEKWSKWLEDNKGKQTEEIKEEGQSIDHLVSKELTDTLMQKGHSKNVAQKALLLTNNTTLENAQKWIQNHKYDEDFEEQLRLQGQAFQTSSLTPEQAKQKLKELTDKAREVRKKRQQQEERERQKNRVRYGKELIEAKRIAQEQSMKRQVQLDKIQKEKDEQYKKKLVEQMKRERNQKLGLTEKVESIEVEKKKEAPKLSRLEQVELQCQQVKVGMHAYPEKAKLFFDTALIYLGNIIKNNGEEKFRKINKENKAFQGRVMEAFGGLETLLVIGYEEDGGFLTLKNYDPEHLKACMNVLDRYAKYY